ncbi:MAG: hypothetical protein WCI73_10995, partial [Phycisphaerae bacterium]
MLKCNIFISASIMIAGVFLASGCDKPGGTNSRKGEMTRELATSLLNEYFAAHPVSEIQFSQDGWLLAKREGVAVFVNFVGYKFTEKGLAMVPTGIANANKIHTDAGDFNAWFQVNPPIIETLREVTGVNLGGPYPEAEFSTKYALPPEMLAMNRYIINGRNTR